MRNLPFVFLGAVAALYGSACVPPPRQPEPEPEDDSLPVVAGLAPIADEDPAVGAVRYTLAARVAEVQLIAGADPVEAWTYNGTVPGPLLQARVGDDVTIVFTNALTEPTTIHWHGMRVPNAMDGVVEGDVVAIAPGETFTYHFMAPDAGTFWFHPHMRPDVQIERGLQGMFVVHEATAEAPDMDADRAFVLDDVALTAAGDIAPFGTDMMEVMHGRYGNALLTNGTDTVTALAFAPGQVERWRLVNTANARTMVVRFPGLAVRQIGADGGLWPQSLTGPVDEVLLPVGARADLEVRMADGADAGSLQSMVQALDENNAVVDVAFDLATVTRDSSLAASTRTGHTHGPAFTYLDDGAPDHTLTLSGQNVGGAIEFTVNGYTWPAHEDWIVDQDSLHILEVQNALGMEHPFHLHGQFFQVVGRATGGVDDRGWRDTTLVRGGETIRIATRFENPGAWMIHCHILEHEENGMMSMVMVTPVQGGGSMP